jgi:hypothetical protein
MTWQFVSKMRRSQSTAPSAQRFRFRPKVDRLEERTLLTIYNFALDPTQSAMTLSGTIQTPIGNGPLQEQAAGSLTTAYEGTVEVDLSNPNITVIPDGTNVVADISGNWQPAQGGGSGSDPANYGGKGTISFVSALAAVRSFSATAASGPEQLTGDDGQGDVSFSSDQTLTIITGNVDYSYSAGIFGSGHGSQDASGYSAQNQATDGTITYDQVSTATLVAPVYVNYVVTFHTSLGDVTANLIIQGQLVGYAPFPSVVGGFRLGSTSLGATPLSLNDGSVHSSPAPSTGTLDTSTAVQAGQPNQLADDMGVHALGNNSAAVDSLAIQDGLAVELFS